MQRLNVAKTVIIASLDEIKALERHVLQSGAQVLS